MLVIGAIFVSGCGGSGEDEATTTTTTDPNPEREKAIEEFQGELEELSEQQQKQLEEK